MANWAAYKEKEIGLPVVKRAKHGIHFDAGKGLVQAEFVGKPCHYLDGKEYKAIDTTPLLRKDGTYGCAHSDVIIHTDGTVQVGDYTQRAALIYPGKISVDGDRIARPFSGGVQYLYITEDGFRQEIVLEKMPDLKKVSALVDTVSGVLPSKYTASSLSLRDSSTAELSDFVQVDSKSLASVLEAAKYPVVIDPDFSATSAAGDVVLHAYNDTVKANNCGTTTISGLNTGTILLRFDCSSVSAAAVCTGVTAKLYRGNYAANTGGPYTANYYSISSANSDWIEGTKNNTTAGSGEPCWNAKEADGSGGVTTAWAGSAGLSTATTDYENTVLGSFEYYRNDAIGTEYSATFNASGISRVEDWFGVTNTNYGLMISKDYRLSCCFKEHDTESYRPVLTVTYTAAGTFIPVNMMANTQNLTAGMRG